MLLVILTCIVLVVVLGLLIPIFIFVRKNADASQSHLVDSWAKPLFKTWGIDNTLSAADKTRIDTTIRNKLLQTMMNYPHKSVVRKDLQIFNDQMVYIGWSAMPTANGRHIYNPSFMKNDIMIARNDNIFDNRNAPCLYESLNIKFDTVGGVSFDAYEAIAFTNEVANSRKKSNKTHRVIEDLRPVCLSKSNYVTGVAMYDKKYLVAEMAVFKMQNNKLELVTVIQSPKNRNVEKNWLFIENNHHFTVLYDAYPLQIYDWYVGDNKLTNARQVQWEIPDEWLTSLNYVRTSSLRLSSLTYVPERKQYMLLLHTKDLDVMYYSYYCVYLNEKFEMEAYVPFPVLTNIAVRVFFVMTCLVTTNYMYFSCGLADEVGGVATYDRSSWESKIKNV